MFIKQLSVFIENREGRLEDALSILKNNDINIVSCSLADNSDYGLLRMIVAKPEEAKKALKDAGFSAMLNDVICARMAHRTGQLQNILKIVCDGGINIEYMYALSTGENDASIVMKTSDPDACLKLLTDAGIELFSDKDAANV